MRFVESIIKRLLSPWVEPSADGTGAMPFQFRNGNVYAHSLFLRCEPLELAIMQLLGYIFTQIM